MNDGHTFWRYEHFQAVSRAGNRYTAIMIVCAALGCIALALDLPDALPIHALLSAIALSGVLVLLAYCGQQRRRRDLLAGMRQADDGEQDPLQYLDAHPSLMDFTRYAMRGAAGPRYHSFVAAAGTAAGFLWFLYLWGYAVGFHWPQRSMLLAVDGMTFLAAFFTTGPLTRLLSPDRR